MVAAAIGVLLLGGAALAWKLAPRATAAAPPPPQPATATVSATVPETNAVADAQSPVAVASSDHVEAQTDAAPMASVASSVVPSVPPTVEAGARPSTAATLPVVHGPMTARPAADVVRAAVASVLPAARRCLTHETFEAEIVFGSDGAVRTVNLSDSESPRVAACVRGALSKARVPAFGDPSYTDSGVVVRPL